MKLKSINPHNYSAVGEVNISTEQEIKEAVKKANEAKDYWKELGVAKRAALLRKVVKQFVKRKGELAKLASKEMGMPISQSRADTDDAIRYFYWYLDNAEKILEPEVTFEDKDSKHIVYHEPIGVAAVIVPWNFPPSNFVWGAGEALIAGNTVVFKDSEEVPLFGKLIEEIFTSCHLPDGVFQEVYGDGKVGALLVHQDIDLICFTGSSAVGTKLYKIAADKFIRVLLEMGGSAPGIVFEDADLDKVLESIYINRFMNTGQACDALKRLIVAESRFDEVVKKLKSYLKIKKIGNPMDPETEIGPLVAKRQLELLESQVKDAIDKGAKAVTGGKRPKNLGGAYYEPTILINVKPNMRVWYEEVFGPLLPVVKFKTEEEAIRLANDTKYGLGAYVLTEDKKRAARVSSQIQSGMVSVNNIGYIKPCNPFGGYKQSGIGREHGKFGFQDVTQVKLVTSEK